MQADMENSVKPSAGQTAKRLFIALRFSAEEQDALAQSRDAVLERLRTGRPSPTANIHLTLAFLGMLDSTGRCRIHPVKPDQCASFPYDWANDNSTTYCPALRALC